ncbi:sulfonate ABC transporter substrate-binding protein [Undibacterium sp. RTI2.2]|nr:sulfonate ABC transporter substrate-binding protein [Undibacterium sp. 10I3]MEB0115837.1 sulfonate ABC transporter substrate-binding protein [Undibacterium sp. RTI2.2]MEB0258314.1 sulfonate ABC transporter substrate-binding protein [Undibacterium sp. 5I1]
MSSPFRHAISLLKFVVAATTIMILPHSAMAALSKADLPSELRIGFQKSSVNLTLLKQRQSLEQLLGSAKPGGVKITWFEFTAGPQMLEALSVGSIDFATTGEPPPIFAQAAGSSLVYVGAEPAKPSVSAILVKQDSPIKTLSDLKGKKIAFQKGSSAHYHVLRAVQQGGLQWSDITPIYLAPADARAAFERGSVDAWAIWDPYWAAIEQTAKPRVLVTGNGLVNNLSHYLSSRSFAEKYPKVIQLLFEELTKSDTFVHSNRPEAIAAIAASTGLDKATIATYLDRRPRSPVVYLTQNIIDEQQRVADNFYQQKLIPKSVNIRDAVWLPPGAK